MMLPDRHLDLGCGQFPRNPYQRKELAGIDIRPATGAPGFDYRVADLTLHPIPFADDMFGSVSAYDFIEHVPRILATADGTRTRFPFVELMQEAWRVLAPGGLFYALTPAYPHAEAFTDPTHVNIITEHTHDYFCGPSPLGRMYGFDGAFAVVRVEWVRIGDAYSAIRGSSENRRLHTGMKRIARDMRSLSRRLRGVDDPGDRRSYLLWELRSVKPAS